MIHGSAGAFTRDGEQTLSYDNFGELTLARQGYVVVLPHYFAAVHRGSITSLGEMRELFPRLLDALSAVLNQASAYRSVDSRRIEIYGESLGGFLAAALASRDSRVVAVSEFSGGLAEGQMSSASAPKALLIQHGEEDDLVAKNNADALRDYEVRRGAQVTMCLYPGQGHYFDQATRAKILERSVAFFHRALKGSR